MGRRVRTLRPALATLAALSLAGAVPAVGTAGESPGPGDRQVQLTVRAGGDRVGVSDEVLPLGGATYRFFETTPDGPTTGGDLVGECTTDEAGSCTVTADLTGKSSFYVEQVASPQGWGSSSRRYISSPVHPQDPADERVLTFPGPGRVFPNLRDTPDVPEAHSLDVAVVYDLSNSVTDHDDLMDTYREAGISLVDAMEGTPSSMAVYTFATSAPAQGASNAMLPLTPLDTDSQVVRDKINSLSATPDPMEGGTNWDMGLAQVEAGSYDLVVFLTDGDPTFHRDGRGPGTETTFRQVEEAAHSANTVKSQAALVAVGIGEAVDDPVSQERLRHLSDLVILTDFDELGDNLIELVPIPEPEPPVDPEPEPGPPIEPEPIPEPPEDPAPPVDPPLNPVEPPVEPSPGPEPPVDPAPVRPVEPVKPGTPPPGDPEPVPEPGPPADPVPGQPKRPGPPSPTPVDPVTGPDPEPVPSPDPAPVDTALPQPPGRVLPLPPSFDSSPPTAESPVNAEKSGFTQTVESSTPVLRLTRSVIDGENVSVGDVVTYVMTATNTGQSTLSDVTIDMRKDGPGALTDMVCTPTSPAILSPGESLVCVAKYEVTGASVSTAGVLVESDMTDGLVPSRTIEVLGASGVDALVSVSLSPGSSRMFTMVLPGEAQFVTDPGPESGCHSGGNRLTCPVSQEEEVFLAVSGLPLTPPVVDGQVRALTPAGEVVSAMAVTEDGSPVTVAAPQMVHSFRSMV